MAAMESDDHPGPATDHPGPATTSVPPEPPGAADGLERLERYYDAVPRSRARAEDFGPLTLFVAEGAGWPFYARPTLSWPSAGRAAEAAVGAESWGRAVRLVRRRQRELGLPEAFEWVHETTPGLRAAIEASVEETGRLTVHEHPLMALDITAPASRAPGPLPGVAVRTVGPRDPVLPGAIAVPHLAFAEPGTRVGTAGPAELDEMVRRCVADGSVARLTARMRAGLTRVAAAVDEETGAALCAGQHQPVGGVSEIVGVGTLPSARRRGLALRVTAALVADAASCGVRTVFLSAGDDDVARVYARLGFRRVGTALIAEPPPPAA
jgi:N-acetylglutamate synthase-like GNAT family acetyltransferase